MTSIEDIHALSRKVHSEPTSTELKPYLLRYIRYYVDQARSASEGELLHGKIGTEVSSRLCGALAWQGAEDVLGEDWITPEREPILSRVLELSCKLDTDSNDLEAWYELFATSEKLEKD